MNETVYETVLYTGTFCSSYYPQIDWEESTNAARVCVRPHIDEELDNLKHIYHGIDAVLVRVVPNTCLLVLCLSDATNYSPK